MRRGRFTVVILVSLRRSVLLHDRDEDHHERGEPGDVEHVVLLQKREDCPVDREQRERRREPAEQRIARLAPEAEEVERRDGVAKGQDAGEEGNRHRVSHTSPKTSSNTPMTAGIVRTIERSTSGSTRTSMKRRMLFSARPLKQRPLQSSSRTR